MTNDEVRIACAEAHGWTKCRLAVKGSGAPERGPSPYGIPPGRNYEAPVPDYPNDLNACHEMEKVLNAHQRYLYVNRIAETKYKLDDAWHHAHATASQRCEAFLRTIGKWKDFGKSNP